MNLTLYSFTKRANSTKRPNGNAKGITGTLKQNTSMLAPIIGFNFGTSDSPKNYNYAYIPDFGRFYFIDDWTWDTGLWYASMTVDPLATWRQEIAGSTEYILRAANAYDGNIIDMTYPTFAGSNIASFNIMNIFHENIASGTYIMSVQASGRNNFGTNTTLALKPPAMDRFAKMLLADTDYLQIDPNEVSENLTKALFNPIQYVSYVVWLPITIDFNSAFAMEKIPLGWWEFDAGEGVYYIDQSIDSVEHIETITLPKHPQVDDKHYYLKNAPYSEYKIYMPGFGLIDIDAAKLYNVDKLKISLKVDLYTGNMTLQLMNGNNPFQTLTGCCGVQAQIGQISSMVNTAGGLIQTAVGGVVGGVQSFLTQAKDITAKVHAFINGANDVGLDTAVSNIGNGIQSGAQQATAESTTKGGQGSVVEYGINPYIIAKFNRIVDQTPETRGYPVCRQMKISSLKGFIMCSDSDFAAPATSEEISAVKAHMNAGFYFE